MSTTAEITTKLASLRHADLKVNLGQVTRTFEDRKFHVYTATYNDILIAHGTEFSPAPSIKGYPAQVVELTSVLMDTLELLSSKHWVEADSLKLMIYDFQEGRNNDVLELVTE